MSSKRNWPTELVKRCEAVGWTVHKRKSHWRVVLPDGLGSLTIPATPSDARSEKNTLAEARRLGLERAEAAGAEAAERARRKRIEADREAAEAACARAGAQHIEPETATGQEATTMDSPSLGTVEGTPIAAVEPAYYHHPRAKAGTAPVRLKDGEHLLLEDGREVWRCAKRPAECRKTFASARALAGHMMQCPAAPKGTPEKVPSASAQQPPAEARPATLPERLQALSGELRRLNVFVDNLAREVQATAEADEATRAKARRYDAMMKAAEAGID